MFFWLESEGVDVDTNGWDVGVVLVWLYQVEVTTFTFRETIVTVELNLGDNSWVVTGHTFNTGDGVTGFQDGAIPPIGVVEWLLSLPWVDDGRITGDEGVTLDDPNQFLCWVVEVHLDLVGR